MKNSQNSGDDDITDEQKELMDQFMLKPMYSTLLFGCNNDNNESSNYEHCLSIPNIMCEKRRINRIKAVFYNRNGELNTCYLKSMDSRNFQHECDHLNGILMTDSIYQNMWDNCIYAEEYARQQTEIIRPKLEQLLATLSVNDQDRLYNYYDPLHPPTDTKLIKILEKLIEQSEASKEQLKKKTEDQDDPTKTLLPEHVFDEL